MYSPKIDEELIAELYKIASKLKRPMTQVVNAMVREGIEKYKSGKSNSQSTKDRSKKTDEES